LFQLAVDLLYSKLCDLLVVVQLDVDLLLIQAIQLVGQQVETGGV